MDAIMSKNDVLAHDHIPDLHNIAYCFGLYLDVLQGDSQLVLKFLLYTEVFNLTRTRVRLARTPTLLS